MPLAPSDDLARTRILFEEWRATRQGRSKIPEELWQAVVTLQDRYSAFQLCRELRLSDECLLWGVASNRNWKGGEAGE